MPKIILKNLHGSLGDIRPFLALGLTLRQAGYEIEICAPFNFKQLCSQYGFKFHSFDYDSQSFFEEKAKDFMGHPAKSLKTAVQIVQKSITDEFTFLKQVVKGADILVGSGVDFAGLSIAEYFGIPYRYVYYSPLLFKSRSYAPMMVPFQKLPGWMNDFCWWAADYFGYKVYGSAINTNRKQLGLKNVEANNFLAHAVENSIVAADPALVSIPDDVCNDYVQTGYWHLEEEQELENDIIEFIEAGPPPIYIGFGSMADPAPAKTVKILQKLIDSQRFRLIISKGWAKLGINNVQRNTLLIDYVPHAKLFPKMAAVVHHGGAGTIHATARAGVPQVIIPHVNDQFYYGERIFNLKLGPKSISRTKLSSNNLIAAIEEAVTNPVLQQNASRMGMILSQSNGLQEALNHFQTLVKLNAKKSA